MNHDEYEQEDPTSLLRYLNNTSASLIDIEFVSRLIENENCDINAQDPFHRQTPLMYAIRKNLNEVFDMLIEHPDVDVSRGARYERTALQIAAMGGKMEFVEALLERDAAISERYKTKWYNTPFNTLLVLIKSGVLTEKFSHFDVIEIIVHFARWRWDRHFQTSEEACAVAMKCVRAVCSHPNELVFGPKEDLKIILVKASVNGLPDVLQFLLQDTRFEAVINNQFPTGAYAFSSCFRFTRCFLNDADKDLSYVKDCINCAKHLLDHGAEFKKAILKFIEIPRKKFMQHAHRNEMILEFYQNLPNRVKNHKETHLFFLFVSLWMNHSVLLSNVVKSSPKSFLCLDKRFRSAGFPFDLALKSLSLQIKHNKSCSTEDFSTLRILADAGATLTQALPHFTSIIGTPLQKSIARELSKIGVDFTTNRRCYSQYLLQSKNRLEDDTFHRLKLDFESGFPMDQDHSLSCCVGCKTRSHRICTERLLQGRVLRSETKCSLCLNVLNEDLDVKLCSSGSSSNHSYISRPVICPKCMFLNCGGTDNSGSARAITPFELSKRSQNLFTLNTFGFLKSEVGERLVTADSMDLTLLLQNAKIDSLHLLKNMFDRKPEPQLGNPHDINKLRNLI